MLDTFLKSVSSILNIHNFNCSKEFAVCFSKQIPENIYYSLQHGILMHVCSNTKTMQKLCQVVNGMIGHSFSSENQNKKTCVL